MLGETIECPSCNGSIELPKPDSQPAPEPPPSEPQAPAPSTPSAPTQKQTKDCPFCGEEILATAMKCKHCGEFLDGRSKAPTPPKSRKSGLQVENDLWKGKPSYLYYLAHFIFGVLLLPVFGIGLLFILFALLDRNTKVFTLTNRRVMSKAGIISRQVHEVGIKDVRNLNVKQGILERLFGLGTVEVGSAGTAGIEVKFAGVSGPIRVRDLIRRQKDEVDSND